MERMAGIRWMIVFFLLIGIGYNALNVGQKDEIVLISDKPIWPEGTKTVTGKWKVRPKEDGYYYLTGTYFSLERLTEEQWIMIGDGEKLPHTLGAVHLETGYVEKFQMQPWYTDEHGLTRGKYRISKTVNLVDDTAPGGWLGDLWVHHLPIETKTIYCYFEVK